MTHPPPPPLARWLLQRLARAEDAPYLDADLAEAFDERCTAIGARAARRWYWTQVAASAVPLIAVRLAPARAVLDASTGDPMWHDMRVDLHYAYRLGRRAWLSTLAVILTMTLGIAATTAVFSVVNALLLRPLPFADQDRVVRIGGVVPSGNETVHLAHPDLLDYRTGAAALAELSAVQPAMLTLLHGADPQQISGARVDDAYARVFAIRPLFGRFFEREDLRPEAPRVAVLAYDLWVREFGGDRRVVGSVISLNNTPYEVIGVLPSMMFAYPVSPVQAFVPLRIPPGSMLNNRGALAVQAVGKMKPGATVEQARTQVKAVAARLALQFPASNTGIGAHVESLRTAVVGPVRDMLLLLGGVVAAVLLIACVNIANLLLGQSQARTRELAVRAALGGSATRLRRQLLTESLGSALIGGVLGIALAPLLTNALVALYPGGLPRANEVGVDLRVLMLAAGATLIAGVAAAVPAARRAARLDLTQDLRTGSRAATRGSRAGGLLVVSQLALSLALVFASGLLLRTFAGLTRVDPGFDANGVITFRLSPPGIKYATPERLRAFYSAVEESIASMPGVRSVATATLLPFGGDSFGDVFVREEMGDQGTRNPRANIVVATPGFEIALGLRVAGGRAFLSSDDSTSERVVLINEAVAKQAYGGVNPIGRYIQWGFGPHWRIVGVVASVHTDGLWDDPGPQLYAPALQAPRWPRFVIVRAALSADQLVPVIRTALRGIDATIPITDVATMERRLSESLAPQRFRAALVGGLGLVAVLLSIIGIYGVVGHAVTSRTREIGIRMALGDEATRVRGRVVGGALRLALAGAGLGAMVALGVGQWLSGFLVGVQPRDPAMLAGATAILFAVTLVAAYGPARRASRVDPIIALRSE